MKPYLNIPVLRDYHDKREYIMTEDKADVWLWVVVIVGMVMFVRVLLEIV